MDWKEDKLYQAYLAAGFKEYESETWNKLKGTPYFVQKEIIKDKKTLFFITVFVYVYPDKVSFQPEAHFKAHIDQTMKNGLDFEVTLIQSDITPSQVELFYRRIYRQMNCEKYS